jgi:hypothetical protein
MDTSFLTLYTQDITVLKFTAAIVAEKKARLLAAKSETITMNVSAGHCRPGLLPAAAPPQ